MLWKSLQSTLACALGINLLLGLGLSTVLAQHGEPTQAPMAATPAETIATMKEQVPPLATNCACPTETPHVGHCPEAMPAACGDDCMMRTAECECGTCDEAPKGLRDKTPVRIFPRMGNFPVPPTGTGYYSALDVLTDTRRDGPPKYPYSPIGLMPKPFFDSDFRYLDSPCNTQTDCFDPIHNIQLHKDWLLSVGGDVRWRHHDETNSRLTGRNNDYDLFRTRVYGDLWYKTNFRVYLEGLDAHSFHPELAPLPIDVNRTDVLNAFVDVKLADIDDAPLYGRVGRQELLLGSQRLVSPLEWANTRRTFEGVRVFRQGENFDVDLFWVQPVLPDPSNFDQVDSDQHFGGIWFTHRPKKGTFTDLYYLILDDDSPQPLLGQTRSFAQSIHTLGLRHVGEQNNWLWDIEAMVQFGDHGEQSLFAGAATVGGGYHFKDMPLHPTFWLYYDYASGDNDPDTVDEFNTFNQLFPFGHYYLGWLDLVGRQNIHDLNAHCFLYPTRWTTVWLQYHHFELDSARDALYNAAGVAIRRDPTGAAGTDVGDEFDIVVNFHLGTHSDVLLGYSKLFAGDFIRNTGSGRDAELFYAQYGYRW